MFEIDWSLIRKENIKEIRSFTTIKRINWMSNEFTLCPLPASFFFLTCFGYAWLILSYLLFERERKKMNVTGTFLDSYIFFLVDFPSCFYFFLFLFSCFYKHLCFYPKKQNTKVCLCYKYFFFFFFLTLLYFIFGWMRWSSCYRIF